MTKKLWLLISSYPIDYHAFQVHLRRHFWHKLLTSFGKCHLIIIFILLWAHFEFLFPSFTEIFVEFNWIICGKHRIKIASIQFIIFLYCWKGFNKFNVIRTDLTLCTRPWWHFHLDRFINWKLQNFPQKYLCLGMCFFAYRLKWFVFKL